MQEISVHGAFDYAELERLGLQPGEVLDFSVNSNPYGPSPRIREELEQIALDRYPDRACLELRRALVQYELAPIIPTIERIVCGNGSVELIWSIARSMLAPGQKAALLGPTFGEYRAASQAAGAHVVQLNALENSQFCLEDTAVISWLQQERPALFWLCNPNNPTGTWLDRSALGRIAQTCRELQTLLVIDEAYWHFLCPRETFSALHLLQASPEVPLIVLRSLTKDCALAGLRLGYAVASSVGLAQRLGAQLPPWNVNSLAQRAGSVALQESEYRTTTLARLAAESQAFFQALRRAGLCVLPSRTHFYLLAVGDGPAVRQKLLARRLLVRDCASFGLPGFIRVATRPGEDWQQLLQALQEVAVCR